MKNTIFSKKKKKTLKMIVKNRQPLFFIFDEYLEGRRNKTNVLIRD